MTEPVAPSLSALEAAGEAAASRRPVAGKDAAKAAKSFEAMMLGQALEAMFEGVPTDGAFGGGFAEEVYRGMMLEAVATSIADSGRFGIASNVRAQIDSYLQAKEG